MKPESINLSEISKSWIPNSSQKKSSELSNYLGELLKLITMMDDDESEISEEIPGLNNTSPETEESKEVENPKMDESTRMKVEEAAEDLKTTAVRKIIAEYVNKVLNEESEDDQIDKFYAITFGKNVIVKMELLKDAISLSLTKEWAIQFKDDTVFKDNLVKEMLRRIRDRKKLREGYTDTKAGIEIILEFGDDKEQVIEGIIIDKSFFSIEQAENFKTRREHPVLQNVKKFSLDTSEDSDEIYQKPKIKKTEEFKPPVDILVLEKIELVNKLLVNIPTDQIIRYLVSATNQLEQDPKTKKSRWQAVSFEKQIVLNAELLWKALKKHLKKPALLKAEDDIDFKYRLQLGMINRFKKKKLIEPGYLEDEKVSSKIEIELQNGAKYVVAGFVLKSKVIPEDQLEEVKKRRLHPYLKNVVSFKVKPT